MTNTLLKHTLGGYIVGFGRVYFNIIFCYFVCIFVFWEVGCKPFVLDSCVSCRLVPMPSSLTSSFAKSIMMCGN